MDTLHYSLDRWEDNDIAVLTDDDGNTLNLPAADLPDGCRPGDMLVRGEDGAWVRDDACREARRARILDLQKRLRRK